MLTSLWSGVSLAILLAFATIAYIAYIAAVLHFVEKFTNRRTVAFIVGHLILILVAGLILGVLVWWLQ